MIVTDRSHWASLALLHPERPALLVVAEGGVGTLPKFPFEEPFFSDVREGPGRIREAFGVDGVALRPLWNRVDQDVRRIDSLSLYELTGIPQREDLAWIEESDLSSIELPQGIPAGRWRDLLRQSLREDADPRLIPVHRPPWSRRGWSPRMRAWVGGALEVLGRPPLGTLEQVRVWGVSTLWRGRTEAGLVYFKAVPPLFSAEGAITSTLERLFPGRVPTVLAFDAGRGWLLLDEFRGRSIPKGDPAWLEVVRSYAAMQIECTPLASELLATGFADRRLEVFQAQIARLFRGSGTVLTWEERGRLTELEAGILASLDELYGFGLPETLVHGDLHFGNVVETVDGPLLFDWTDAAVAHPFLDLFTLLDFDLDSDGAVRQSYLEPWQTSWDGHDLDRAFDIAIDLSLVYSAISYQLIVEAQEPADRWQLGGFVEWALRELLRRTGL